MSSTVKSLSGKYICELEGLKAEDTVSDVKKKIGSLTGVTSQCLKIRIKGRFTRDNLPISFYKWQSGDPVVVVRSDCCLAEKTTPQVECVPQVTSAHLSGFSHARQAHYQAATDACSSPRSILSEDSASTVATTSDRKRVRFCDGLRPGQDELSHEVKRKSMDTLSASCAEWIYIDRDICGFSLYEYAPDDPKYAEFASSRYGRMFQNELSLLVSRNRRDQRAARANVEYREMYYKEEQELHEALRAAGVRESHLEHEIAMAAHGDQ